MLLISEKRMIQDARKAFQRVKAVGKIKPDRVVTDGLHSYEDAFKREFFHSEKSENQACEDAKIR